MIEGFRFIGMEMEPEYATIAKARILRALADRSTNTTEAT